MIVVVLARTLNDGFAVALDATFTLAQGAKIECAREHITQDLICFDD